MSIPFLDLRQAHAELRSELRSAFERVMQSGQYILGEELELFEHEFARFSGTRHAIGVGNGLDALTIALRSIGVGAGDEVIVAGPHLHRNLAGRDTVRRRDCPGRC